MSDAELAQEIAERAHAGQTDRGGKPYINHPMAVASGVEGDLAKTAALLHDTVEDTDLTIDSIRVIFGDEVAEIVSLLTHREGVPYMEYVENIKKNPIAVEIKKSDLRHNLDPSRLGHEPTEKDLKRFEKYKAAMACLAE